MSDILKHGQGSFLPAADIRVEAVNEVRGSGKPTEGISNARAVRGVCVWSMVNNEETGGKEAWAVVEGQIVQGLISQREDFLLYYNCGG